MVRTLSKNIKIAEAIFHPRFYVKSGRLSHLRPIWGVTIIEADREKAHAVGAPTLVIHKAIHQCKCGAKVGLSSRWKAPSRRPDCGDVYLVDRGNPESVFQRFLRRNNRFLPAIQDSQVDGQTVAVSRKKWRQTARGKCICGVVWCKGEAISEANYRSMCLSRCKPFSFHFGEILVQKSTTFSSRNG